ncbi:TonB-dependent receptor domain-containing protein [Sporomusa termitida]|uniref:Vitamin B12 transporter BtuB n=1 Tax=Sporomusa termitida TaxID=2377 RepID=A0A517E1F1_9FIRM|nr:TonB-dependent receptor [Sporomusa termitida]QDR83423.1 Vitamin B12 transporter BtuB [Sporomusa termitida]
MERKGMIKILNHIYKVVWNRTRACWQVVSELAKNNGRAKSVRRRCGAKSLAARVACVLALGVMALPAVAWADNATADYQYIDLGGWSRDAFRSGSYQPANEATRYYPLQINSSQLNYTYNGSTYNVFGAAGIRNLLREITPLAAAGSNPENMQYNALAVKINGKLYCTTVVTGATSSNWSTKSLISYNITNIINSIDKNLLDVATQNRLADIMALPDGSDKEQQLTDFVKEYAPPYEYCLVKLTGAELAKMQGLTNPPATDEGVAKLPDYEIVGDSSLQLEDTSSLFQFTQTVANLTPGQKTYAYNEVKVGESSDNSWRPLDRVLYMASGSVLDTDYAVNKNWVMDSDGNLIPDSSGGTIDWQNDQSVQPLPADVRTAITVKDLRTVDNSVIDLTYANTSGDDPLINHVITYSKPGAISNGEIGHIDGYFTYDHVEGKVVDRDQSTSEPNRYSSHKIARSLFIENATLAAGTTFRLGNYSMDAALQHAPASGTGKISDTGFVTPNDFNSAMYFSTGNTDSVYITNATQANTAEGKTNLNLQLGWVPGLGYLPAGEAVLYNSQSQVNLPVLLGILNGAENFNVQAQKSVADGVLSTYEITPVIEQTDNYFTDPEDAAAKKGTAWWLKSYSFVDTGEMSTTGKAVSDNSIINNNLWRSSYLNMFRRTADLHARYGGSADLHSAAGADGDGRENVWAQAYHGKVDGKSRYGGSFDQSYNGVQVGYDKLLNKAFYNGRVYTGFYLNKIDGKSTTQSGSGEQDSLGGGLYGAWVGDKGHYLDAGVTASKLKNEFSMVANLGDGTGNSGIVDGTSRTWGYGMGLQYGKLNALADNWWWEPAASFFLGHVDATTYQLSNHLRINQRGYDNATGRLHLRLGKEINDKGTIYAGVNLAHEFAGEQDIHAVYGYQNRSIAAAGGKDTWWEFNVGGTMKISPDGNLNLDFVKTTGSDIGSDWRIDGKLDFAWGGFGGGKGVTGSGAAVPGADKAQTTTVVMGQVPPVEPRLPERQVTAPTEVPPSVAEPNRPETAGNAENQDNTTVSYSASEAAPAVKADTTVVTLPTGTANEFAFTPVTVQAARPDWEKKLSPGQVSVIYPDTYKGEQKDLPAMLEAVPGLYVQRITGAGHYTVARVRGATGAQVKVFVDGVLMNLNSESAVNLSAIPVDNVERIEVYRGYVPARFGGAPLGGVINIVTKKPDQLGGMVSQGVKSYGGYTGNYQFTAPVGSGSLLATFQRDIWGGDFDFHASNPVPDSNRYAEADVKRTSNGYQNSNGMVKWQNDNWTVKAAWKKLHEELPFSVGQPFSALPFDPTNPQSLIYFNKENLEKGLWDKTQDIDQKEFLLGRRATAGKLDWGWQVSYLDNKKDYYNTGYYKRKAILDAIGVSPGYIAGMEDPQYPGTLWAHYHSKKWGFNLNTAYKMGDSHLLEFSGDVSRETMKANVSEQDTLNLNLGLGNRKYIDQYKIREYHFSVQDTITLNEAGDFKLTPVVRAEKVDMETMNEADKKWRWSAGTALQKQLNDHWSVKTSWGTYNRHPNFYELFGDGATIIPNPGANKAFDAGSPGTWESGTQFDFSINWQGELATADTDTVLTWFQRRAKNQFALWMPQMPNAPSTYFPMDEAKVHGLELTHNMKWQRLSLNLAGTWQKPWYPGAKAVLDIQSSGPKTSISYTPEWVVNARLDYRWPGDKLNTFIEYNYMDEQFIGQTEDDGDPDAKKSWWMDGLSTFNVGAKYKFDKNWKLAAGINDIFDKGPEVTKRYGAAIYTNNYPLAGRMYYGTLEYSF